MTPLPTSFEGTRDQRGYVFEQLIRTGQVALFEKHNPAHSSGSKSFEVVVIQSRPQKTWPDGRVTPEREAMPSPEEWGMLGWSPPILEAAEERFEQVVADQEKS